MEEVEQLLKKKDPTWLVFEAEQVLKRVDKIGDLFEPTLKLKQKLPQLSGIEEDRAGASEAGLEISAQAERPAKDRKAKAKPALKRAVPKKRRKL
jgi:hypothetical protein